MREQDFENRIIIVARRDIESWQSLNAISHIAAYFGKMLGERLVTGDNFETKDEKIFPRNSQYPIILKSTSSEVDLKKFLEEVRESGVLYHAFIREMIDHTSDEDLQAALSLKNENEVEILAVGIYCGNEQASKLTKKFSLWK